MINVWNKILILAFSFVVAPAVWVQTSYADQFAGIAPNLKIVDQYTLRSDKNLLTDYQPRDPDGRINVVVEIPAGTNQKWEVTKPKGLLEWEKKKGKPRIIKYLAYPGNYGMVPRTLLPEELGGDGDPLDVLVLGPAFPRGSVLKAKVIGVLKLLDGGEIDDKIIAVDEGNPLGKVNNMRELDQEFPGAKLIIETWFTNYKGPGEMNSLGFAEVDDAEKIIASSINAFERHNK